MSPFVLLPTDGPSFDQLILSTNPVDWWKLDEAVLGPPFNSVDNSRLQANYSTTVPSDIAFFQAPAFNQSVKSIYNTAYPYGGVFGSDSLHYQISAVTGPNRNFPNPGTSVAFWYKDTGWWNKGQAGVDNWPGVLGAADNAEGTPSNGFIFYVDRTGQTNGSPTNFNITLKFQGAFRGTGLTTAQNVWRFFTIVRETDNSWSYYQNGSFVLNDTAGSVSGIDKLTTERRFGSGLAGSTMQHWLDDVLLWNTALTGPQVTQIYNWMTA